MKKNKVRNQIDIPIRFLNWKKKIKKKTEYLLNVKKKIFRSREKKMNQFNSIILFILLRGLKEESKIL